MPLPYPIHCAGVVTDIGPGGGTSDHRGGCGFTFARTALGVFTITMDVALDPGNRIAMAFGNHLDAGWAPAQVGDWNAPSVIFDTVINVFGYTEAGGVIAPADSNFSFIVFRTRG